MHEVNLFSHSLPLIREIGHMIDKDGTSRHPDRKMETINVFVYVKKGIIHVFEDEVEYRLNEGSYLFLRKNVAHRGGDLYSPGAEWYYIHFYDSPNQTNLEKTQEYSYFQQSSIILEDTYTTKMTLPKHGKVLNADYTELQLTKLLKEYDSMHPVRPLHLCLMTYQFFIEIYTNKVDESKDTKTHRIIGQMIDLFRNSSTEKLSGEEIANALGMNYAYLSTLFRKHTGKSIIQFQNELLIEKAINLFKNTSINVSEVSNELGFSNPFYFSRVFKQVTGVSPTTYLNQNYRN